jgi:PilZ domain-containing protein
MDNQRHQFRIPVSRRGLVIQEKTTVLCEVTDITERGLHFSTDLPLALRERVRIECQLDEDCVIHCEVFITHAKAPDFGGRIVHILPEHQQQLAMFIQRLILTSMAGL